MKRVHWRKCGRWPWGAAFLALLLQALAVTPSEAGRATGAELSERNGGSRFVLELSDEPSLRAFVISNPARLVVDLDDLTFRLPDGAAADAARGVVRSWRYGRLDDGAGRIVFDLSAPALLERQFYLPALSGRPGRLVLDVMPVDAARFAAAERAATAEADAPAVLAALAETKVVVIDPGHGGIDPGAVTEAGLEEKAVVMAFAERLRDALEGVPGLTVRLTRTDDAFLSLNRRIRIARAFNADLFLSLHADSAPQDYVHGATVYTLSERASDAEAAALAARENLADRVSGAIEPERQEDVSGILADLMRKETKAFSHEFADTLIGHLSGAVVLNSNPHRSARFRVLMAHDFPSVLLELGYLTNSDDAATLVQDDWQARASRAVAGAVLEFLELSGGLPAPHHDVPERAANRVGLA
ncbi:MAG: N-acetylmuramoyl-L-alanine amidase, partial [Pseudomonadota bacterium]